MMKMINEGDEFPRSLAVDLMKMINCADPKALTSRATRRAARCAAVALRPTF